MKCLDTFRVYLLVFVVLTCASGTAIAGKSNETISIEKCSYVVNRPTDINHCDTGESSKEFAMRQYFLLLKVK